MLDPTMFCKNKNLYLLDLKGYRYPSEALNLKTRYFSIYPFSCCDKRAAKKQTHRRKGLSRSCLKATMQHGSRGVVGGTVPTGTERKGLFFSFFEGIVRRAEGTVGDCGHMNTGCSFISWQVRKQRVIHFSTQVAFSIFPSAWDTAHWIVPPI